MPRSIMSRSETYSREKTDHKAQICRSQMIREVVVWCVVFLSTSVIPKKMLSIVYLRVNLTALTVQQP